MNLVHKIQDLLIKYNLDISTLFLLAVIVTFPLSSSPLVIVAFFVSQIIRIIKNNNFKLKTNTFFWFFIALFALDLLGLVYTQDFGRGMSILSRQYLIIPFVLIFSIYPPKNYVLIFKVYILAVMGYILAHELDVIYRFFYQSDIFPLDLDLFFSYRYTGARLTELTGIQNAFFGMYIIFSNILLLFFLNRVKKTLYLIGLVFIIAFQSFFILQLVAKTAILINLIIVISSLFYYLIKYKNSKALLIVFVIGFSATFFTIKYMQLPLQRIQERYDEMKSDKKVKRISRKKIWKASFAVIKKNKIVGVGTGDVQGVLKNEYSKRGFVSDRNTHNQFLDYTVRYGIIGFLLFTSFLLYSIYFSIKNNSFILLFYTLLIIGSFLTENIFDRMWGVTFYATFTYLLYLYTIQKSNNHDN